jgi:hypothetical protein
MRVAGTGVIIDDVVDNEDAVTIDDTSVEPLPPISDLFLPHDVNSVSVINKNRINRATVFFVFITAVSQAG